MRRKVRQPILPFRHPERSRGIFPVAAVYDMHAAAQKIARALISHSPFHRCARKISRFARNDDTGKALLSFSACLRRISPLAFIPRAPYPPLRGTFPSRGRLLVHGGGILVSPPSPWREGSWTSPSFLWKEVSRRGGGWLPQRDETKSETAHPPVSSSRAQPSIFLAGGKTVHMRKSVIPSPMKYGVYRSSHTLRFTGVQGRFLASLEMAIRGRRYSHFPPV